MSGERDAETWRRSPLTEYERALDAAEHWLPAENWSSWLPLAGEASGADEPAPPVERGDVCARVVSLDNLRTLPRAAFRRRVTRLSGPCPVWWIQRRVAPDRRK